MAVMNDVHSSTASIFLLRHGHVQCGAERRFIGRSDVPLSPDGLKQAHDWAHWFSRRPPARVVSSDLSRARRTAEIIGGRCGVPVETMAGLREIDLGGWEGLAFETVRERFPGDFERRGADMADFRPPGGESFGDLQLRAVAAFGICLERTPGSLLIVSHAGVIRVLLCHLLGMPLANLFRLGQICGTLTIIRRRGPDLQIEAMNMAPPRAIE